MTWRRFVLAIASSAAAGFVVSYAIATAEPLGAFRRKK